MVEHYLERALRPGSSLLTDWKLLAGTLLFSISLLLAVWVLRGWDGESLQLLHFAERLAALCKDKRFTDWMNLVCTLYYVGFNLVVLALFQHSHTFWFILQLLGIVVVANLTVAHGLPCIYHQLGQHRVERISTVTWKSAYGDFRSPLSNFLICFIGQGAITILFMEGALELFETETFSYWRWAVSMSTFQFLACSFNYHGFAGQLGSWYSLAHGNRCQTKVWTQLLYRVLWLKHGSINVRVVSDHFDTVPSGIIRVGREEVLVHWFASFLVDAVLYSFFLFVTPLVLGHSKGLDYVFNLFAIGFVNMIDDIDEVVFEFLDDQKDYSGYSYV